MPRMAYVPPAGDKLVEANSCYLVWLPDAVEYRAAFWGAYSALADYWLWDAPDPDDQADIVTSWLGAIGNTLECLDMACLESLTDMMRQVRDAIIANACCPPGSQYIQYNNWDILIYGDDEAIPESNYSRSNPPPDYETDPTGATPFGSEALEDFLCAMAHFVWTVVNNILLYGRAWTDSVLSGLGLMQYLAGWVGRLLFAQTDLRRVALWAWGTVGLPSFNDIATINRAQFDVALLEWEAAREDVVCTLLGENDPDGWKLSLDTLLPLVFSESLVATAVSYFIPGAFFALVWNGLMKPDTWAGEVCDCEFVPETGDLRITATDHYGTAPVHEYFQHGQEPFQITVPVVYDAPLIFDGTYYQTGGVFRMYEWNGSAWVQAAFQWAAHSISPLPVNVTSSYGVRLFQQETGGAYYQADGTTPTLPTTTVGGFRRLWLHDATTVQADCRFAGTITLTVV